MSNLIELVGVIPQHKALNNAFYEGWVNQSYSIKKLAIFSRNYAELTRRFPDALALAIAKTDNLHAKIDYIKTLYSEMGYGEYKKAHSLLFDDFCCQLSKQMGEPGFLSYENLSKTLDVLPTTNEAIAKQQELYSSSQTVAAGAQLALEWQAYTMISNLYEGARNYRKLWQDNDGFHESCEFFYVHIGAAEKDHKEESLHAASELVRTSADFEKLKYGFNTHLDALALFWSNVGEAMN